MTCTRKPPSVFTRAEVLADAADDLCSMRQSLECVAYDFQLPKSFYADSVISVISYTTRFVCFYDIVALVDWCSTLHDCVYWVKVYGLFSEKVHQGGWPCSWLYYSFVVNKKFECWWFSCVSCNKYIIFKNIITYLSCLICILSMFDEKNPPKTWPICDIVTGTIKSALGHVLHAMLLNKTNLPENNICSALHIILKS